MKRNYVRIHHRKTPVTVLILLFFLSGVLNAAAWRSTAFANWYTNTLFPVFTSLYGRLTSLAPFSVGERLLVIGVLWVLDLAVITLLLVPPGLPPLSF